MQLFRTGRDVRLYSQFESVPCLRLVSCLGNSRPLWIGFMRPAITTQALMLDACVLHIQTVTECQPYRKSSTEQFHLMHTVLKTGRQRKAKHSGGRSHINAPPRLEPKIRWESFLTEWAAAWVSARWWEELWSTDHSPVGHLGSTAWGGGDNDGTPHIRIVSISSLHHNAIGMGMGRREGVAAKKKNVGTLYIVYVCTLILTHWKSDYLSWSYKALNF